MTPTSGSNLYESQSITQPPYFSGDNYPYWKNRKRLFIKSNDYQIKMEISDEDMRRMKISDKAMHMMFCALGPDEYAKMSSCTNHEEGKRRRKEKRKWWRRRKLELLLKLHLKRVIQVGKMMKKWLYLPNDSQGHIRTECPQLKNKRFGKKKKNIKAQIATWSDKESSDEEEKEVTNLCLMALEEDLKVTSNSSYCDLTYDELIEEFEELQEVYDELVIVTPSMGPNSFPK
ncbi:hypothetical protein GQ457_09G018750 [Hibiscus cannabinus]